MLIAWIFSLQHFIRLRMLLGIRREHCSQNSLTQFTARKQLKANMKLKISFTAVTAQHMLLLCVKMSRDNLNSAFGRLVLWCLFFDNKDAVGKTYPERTEWVFLQRLPSRLGCFWHTDSCSRCFQLTVIILKNKLIFFRISLMNIDAAAASSSWKCSQ